MTSIAQRPRAARSAKVRAASRNRARRRTVTVVFVQVCNTERRWSGANASGPADARWRARRCAGPQPRRVRHRVSGSDRWRAGVAWRHHGVHAATHDTCTALPRDCAYGGDQSRC
jgi:hypothetical protein